MLTHRLNSRTLSRLFRVLYPELRAMAARQFTKERIDHTLQPTALVHEAFIRLARSRPRYISRPHFFGTAARAMDQILTDHARRQGAQKRGGGWQKLPLDGLDVAEPNSCDLSLLGVAMRRLRKCNPLLHRIVELRVIEGRTARDAARTLGIGESTLRCRFGFARAWLRREIGSTTH